MSKLSNRIKRVECKNSFIVGHYICKKEDDVKICKDEKVINILSSSNKLLSNLSTDGRVQILNYQQFNSFIRELKMEYEELPDYLEVAKLENTLGYFTYSVSDKGKEFTPVELQPKKYLSDLYNCDLSKNTYSVNIHVPEGSDFIYKFPISEYEGYID